MLHFSTSYENKVEHYRVRKNDKGRVTVDDEEYFDNLFKLVEVSLLMGLGTTRWVTLDL